MKGIISAGHMLTAEAGIEMLREGGNAFDASLAASFASFVCESPLTSIGGGGFLMAHSADGPTLLYDFFPNVPGLGKDYNKDELDFYPVDIDFSGTVQEFHIGRASAAVPGCMAGLSEVYDRHCTLPLKTIMGPALHYAREGFVLNAQQAYFNKILSPILTLTDQGKKVYAPSGEITKEGGMIVKREMADTLLSLAEDGLKSFYHGHVASKIVDEFGVGGLITEEDMRSYRVYVRAPLEVTYRGKKIYTNPPPSSSGGCLIAFSLKLLEKFDLEKLSHNSGESLKLLYQVMRMTDEARGEDFDHKIHDEGVAKNLLSDDVIETYKTRMTGDVYSPAGVECPSTGNTTHISVVDERGNAVSVTTSNGEGCGHMISGAGVMLNNMLGEEDINPHGFHKQKPGERMSSMMSPTIIMEGGSVSAVLGSGGSNRIRNAIFQVIINLIDYGLPVHEAVNSARVHWDKTKFQMEPGIDKETKASLENSGIKVNSWSEKNMYFGGVHTVITESDKSMSGAGDLRRGGVCLINDNK